MSREIKRTDIAFKIRNRRKELNLTQVQVAEKLDIKRNTYARYETDTIPPISILTKIGDLLGLTADELLRNDIMYNITSSTSHEQVSRFKNVNVYNTNNENINDLTDEEISTLVKIVYLSPEKREQLMSYIAKAVEDENAM